MRIRTLALLLWVGACTSPEHRARAVLDLSEHFETPHIPASNPLTPDKVTLGRWLFYDERLSGNGSQSCATCHEQALGFTDGIDRPTGSTGDVIPRNSQGLVNIAWLGSLTWASTGLVELEQQIHVPLRAESPVELGMNDGNEQEILDRLRDDSDMAERFADAFPDAKGKVNSQLVVAALASFVRSLVSANSPYDRFLLGDRETLSPSARRGMALFNGHPMECFHCHTGTHLTTSYRDASSVQGDSVPQYFNTGLYDVDGTGSYPAHDQGLHEETLDPDDRGRFRVPSLRNVAVTAPYMHDGSIATLREAVLHYASGGRNLEEGPHAGDGRTNPLKSGFVHGFPITDEELTDVVAFLESLTDETFLTDERFGDPR